ncbi:MAG: hypothetical protein IZT60_06380 [Gammaproteobacteria bacterium]|nr:hypothetical protein [Gammaproteobacteria bacterium]
MMTMKHVSIVLVSSLLYFSVASLAYASLPAGLMIVAFDGASWHPYIVNTGNDGWIKIEDVRDPAALTWQREKDALLIKQNDGGISSYQLETREMKQLPSFDESTVTQLRAYRQGVVMVRLMDGKSRDTSILSVKNNGNKPNEILRQVSAQFHPYIHNDQLYYAHVSCRAECRPLIQEVWSKNLLSGRTQQLTLLNATSYLYSVTADDRYGFISSNQRGYYHLARLDLASGETTWLTGGAVTDSFPSVATDGALYFIRRTPAGSRLMKLPAAAMSSGVVSEEFVENIQLPADVQKIRYLELNQS